MEHRKIVVAITGASGAVYAKVLLDQLLKIQEPELTVAVLMSDNARAVWEQELGDASYTNYPFAFYGKYNFNAPFASGSAKFDTMIICPCSMGTLGRIATGVSNDLTTRAADVILKERRKLILVARETPYSLIHINNMQTVTQAGGIICPATPSFYSKPQTFEELAFTVVARVIDLAALPLNAPRWGD